MGFEDLFDKHKKKHGKLKDINVNEVSMVSSPANEEPFLFFKNQERGSLSLQDVLEAEAENFDAKELVAVKSACVQLQKISEKEAEAISILVLGSHGDSPAVVVDEKENINLSDDLEDDDSEVLSAAMETLGDLDTDQLSAVRVLLKMDEGIAKAIWPSLSGGSAVDDDEPVKKNTGELIWPSCHQHITATQPVKKDTSGLLWPSLSGRAAG